MQFNKICVLGLGYIGLPTACTFATHGAQVVGVDINPKVISTLNSGGLHLSEPGLRMLVDNAVSSGRLKVSDSVEPADAFVIAVPTPFITGKQGSYNGRPYHLADMGAVEAAAQSITPHLRPGNLVVLESTSPPRTTLDLVRPILEKSGLRAGADFFLAYSPERVLPGQIIRELTENARVIGGIDTSSAAAGRELYACFVQGEIFLTDATTAEMIKLMENTYRDINIAIANEFSRLAEHLGVDIWEAINIANRHPRVKILNPGPGVGGHCISVDPWFLVEVAPDKAELIHTARHVNDTQPIFAFDLIKLALKTQLKGKRIAALGLAFKPGVDDLRESPAIEVVKLLQQEGAIIRCFEPYATNASVKGCSNMQTLNQTIADVDVIILLVGHPEFKSLDPVQLRELTPARLVVDTVGGWDVDAWKSAGFTVFRLGNGKNSFD